MSTQKKFKFVMSTPESFSPKSPENNENNIPLDLTEEELLILGDPICKEPDSRWFQQFSPIVDQRGYKDGAFQTSEYFTEESVFNVLRNGNFGGQFTGAELETREYYYNLLIFNLENQVIVTDEHLLINASLMDPTLEIYHSLLQQMDLMNKCF